MLDPDRRPVQPHRMAAHDVQADELVDRSVAVDDEVRTGAGQLRAARRRARRRRTCCTRTQSSTSRLCARQSRADARRSSRCRNDDARTRSVSASLTAPNGIGFQTIGGRGGARSATAARATASTALTVAGGGATRRSEALGRRRLDLHVADARSRKPLANGRPGSASRTSAPSRGSSSSSWSALRSS